mmetsp:Transcript_83922/g.237765  ORF Transcript_83922/g.237765 Transcript_83922/m.237765 type:complete len:374 (-) Transcript_83922:160-1281(-)
MYALPMHLIVLSLALVRGPHCSLALPLHRRNRQQAPAARPAIGGAQKEHPPLALLSQAVAVVRSGRGLASAARLRAQLRRLRWLTRCLSEASRRRLREARGRDAPRDRDLEEAAQLMQEVKQGSFQQSLRTAPSDSTESLAMPDMPFEPLLDVDYILDSGNYLEDFIQAEDLPQGVAEQYTTSRATRPPTSTRTTKSVTTTTRMTRTTTRTTMSGPTTTATTETTTGTTATVTDTTATVPSTATTTGTTTTVTSTPTIPPITFINCHTRIDPRTERRFQFLFRARPAAQGTPCLFGVAAEDESSHCVMDGGRYGSFGWCYTKPDRSQWGSCSEGCPLEGSAELLAGRIDRLTDRVEAALTRIDASQCNMTAAR